MDKENCNENGDTPVRLDNINSEALLCDALRYFPVIDQHLRSIRALSETLRRYHIEGSDAYNDYLAMHTQCTNILQYINGAVQGSMTYLAQSAIDKKSLDAIKERANAPLQ